MKNLILKSILAVLIASATTVRAQDYPREYLGLPGDNLNLYAVMDLFRNSETLEGFERSLNNPNSRINNLDLNGDNLVDYITVYDYVNRKVHTIVLRTSLGRNEYQDVAVFTVRKMGKKKVMIQLIGDEALYGPNYIIEPLIAKRLRQNFYSTPVYADNVSVINNYYYEVYEWPVIVYIYHPHYHGWHSSWYWGYYPAWWSPWSPYYWDFYYGYHSCWHPHYYTWYHHWDYPRYRGYHDHYYHSIRQKSPQVHQRLAEGRYRETYRRPEQRSEGAALYNRIREERGEPSRRPAVATETKRTPAQVATQNNGTRRSTVTTPEVREAERRATDARSVQGRESERREAAARASEERTIQAREIERREAASRASEERATQAREATSRASRESNTSQGSSIESFRREGSTGQGSSIESFRRESNTSQGSSIESFREERQHKPEKQHRELQKREQHKPGKQHRELQREGCTNQGSSIESF